ncbi:MAG: helix-turn-helix transcriptional regulator [Firmicutes bacterium]|nr:helix-turn-helix transcriptional regulator [Bacillota bacterium]
MRNIEKDMIEMKRKREKILEAAFRLFSDTSIDAVSMNAVAAASEIGVATIYRYFKTKPDLVTEVAVTRWRCLRRNTSTAEIKRTFPA